MLRHFKKPHKDPWHTRSWFIYTRTGCFTVLILNIVLFGIFNFKMYLVNLLLHGVFRFDATLQDTESFLESTLFINCTMSPDFREECKNMTEAVREAELIELIEFRTRVYDFIVYAIFMSVSLWLLGTVYRTSYEKTYFTALQYNCLLSYDLMESLTEAKSEYLKCYPKGPFLSEERFVRQDEYGLHMFMNERLVFGKWNKYHEMKESFEEIMLREPVGQPYFSFLQILGWINDLLRAVKMMHKKNVYHLGLQPKIVYLHWLQSVVKTNYQAWVANREKNGCLKCFINAVIELDRHEYSEKRHIILADFNHAVKSEPGDVPVSNIGVPDCYKPPESYIFEVVDGAKVDSWCIGVIAYELLTGGMLTIRADRFPPNSTCEEIISETLNKEFLSTALHAQHHFMNCFLDIRFMQKTFENYDLDQTVFATECWTFLVGLLQSNPEQRYSIQQALRHPLMTRVRRNARQIFYINNPL